MCFTKRKKICLTILSNGYHSIQRMESTIVLLYSSFWIHLSLSGLELNQPNQTIMTIILHFLDAFVKNHLLQKKIMLIPVSQIHCIFRPHAMFLLFLFLSLYVRDPDSLTLLRWLYCWINISYNTFSFSNVSYMVSYPSPNCCKFVDPGIIQNCPSVHTTNSSDETLCECEMGRTFLFRALFHHPITTIHI